MQSAGAVGGVGFEQVYPVGEGADGAGVRALATGQRDALFAGAGRVGFGGRQLDEQEGFAGAVVEVYANVGDAQAGKFAAAQCTSESDKQREGVAAAGRFGRPTRFG